jgi:cytoskeleton protein RodZ
MGSFGDRLKKEREQRGITLDDISLTTKIGTRLLRALEEEKFEQLPGGIFNKGFVRAYARHVGLDEDQTIADYMTAVGSNQPTPIVVEESFPGQVPQERKAPPPAPERRVRPARTGRETAAEIPWGILAVALLVIAIALASWSYLHRPAEPVKSQSAPAPTSEPAPSSGSATDNNSQPAPPPAPAKTESTPQNGNPAPQNTAAPQNTNSAPATPIPTTEQMQSRRSPISPAGLQTSVSAQSTTPLPGMFAVRLKGNDDSEQCWVSISADDQPPVEATFVAPYERVIQAKTQIVVKVGSAGALDVYFNNKKLPSQGDIGMVKTLVFHPDGLQPPAQNQPEPSR